MPMTLGICPEMLKVVPPPEVAYNLTQTSARYHGKLFQSSFSLDLIVQFVAIVLNNAKKHTADRMEPFDKIGINK